MAEATHPTPKGSAAESLQALLADFRPDPGSYAPVAAQQAVHLARILLRRATELQTPHEENQQQELERILQSPHDKATLMQMTDQGLRSNRAARAVEQLICFDLSMVKFDSEGLFTFCPRWSNFPLIAQRWAKGG